MLTQDDRPPPNAATQPSRPSIIVVVVLAVLGLGLIAFGLSLWAGHVSYAACVRPAAYTRPSQAQMNILIAHCRSVGAWHNRGIGLTFSGLAVVVLGLGAACTAWMRARR